MILVYISNFNEYESNITVLAHVNTPLKVLSRTHAIDVLAALNSKKQDGMTFSEIQYNVVKSSGAASLLSAMKEVNLIRVQNRRYHITEIGEDSLEKAISIPGASNKQLGKGEEHD